MLRAGLYNLYNITRRLEHADVVEYDTPRFSDMSNYGLNCNSFYSIKE